MKIVTAKYARQNFAEVLNEAYYGKKNYDYKVGKAFCYRNKRKRERQKRVKQQILDKRKI